MISFMLFLAIDCVLTFTIIRKSAYENHVNFGNSGSARVFCNLLKHDVQAFVHVWHYAPSFIRSFLDYSRLVHLLSCAAVP